MIWSIFETDIDGGKKTSHGVSVWVVLEHWLGFGFFGRLSEFAACNDNEILAKMAIWYLCSYIESCFLHWAECLTAFKHVVNFMVFIVKIKCQSNIVSCYTHSNSLDPPPPSSSISFSLFLRLFQCVCWTYAFIQWCAFVANINWSLRRWRSFVLHPEW